MFNTQRHFSSTENFVALLCSFSPFQSRKRYGVTWRECYQPGHSTRKTCVDPLSIWCRKTCSKDMCKYHQMLVRRAKLEMDQKGLIVGLFFFGMCCKKPWNFPRKHSEILCFLGQAAHFVFWVCWICLQLQRIKNSNLKLCGINRCWLVAFVLAMEHVPVLDGLSWIYLS